MRKLISILNIMIERRRRDAQRYSVADRAYSALVQDRAHAKAKDGERTGQGRQPPRRGRASASLRPADHCLRKTQLLPGDRTLLPPSQPPVARNLEAVGASDHTSLPSASMLSSSTIASTAPRAAFVTIANAPFPGRDGESVRLIGSDGKSYFDIPKQISPWVWRWNRPAALPVRHRPCKRCGTVPVRESGSLRRACAHG